MTEQFFTPCPLGLEKPLSDELKALGADGIHATDIAGNFDTEERWGVESGFAFEAAVIGGAGSLWGTLLGGIVLGVAQNIGAQISPQGFLISEKETLTKRRGVSSMAGFTVAIPAGEIQHQNQTRKPR